MRRFSIVLEGKKEWQSVTSVVEFCGVWWSVTRYSNNGFQLVVEFCGFRDLGMKGHQFTWEKCGEGSSDFDF